MSTSTSHRSAGGARRAGARGGAGDGGGGDEGGGGGGGGEGPLVKVAFARHQSEAEMLQALLLQEGIPSVLNRVPGFYSVSYAPGPADVLVSAGMAPRAREVLAGTMAAPETDEAGELERRRAAGGPTTPGRLAFWICTAAVGAFGLAWLLYQLT